MDNDIREWIGGHLCRKGRQSQIRTHYQHLSNKAVNVSCNTVSLVEISSDTFLGTQLFQNYLSHTHANDDDCE